MLKNYLLVTVRSIMKSRLYIFINVFGMSIAIGCCIVAFFNYEFDATFDDYHEQGETIYRVSSLREFEGIETLYGQAPLPLATVVNQNIGDVNNVVRYAFSYSNFKVNDDLFPADLAYVDSTFFDVFTVELLSGSKESLRDKSKIFLSDEAAVKLFGTTEVVGTSLTQVIGTELKEMEVGGVFKKFPDNTSFSRRHAFTQFDNYYDEFPKVEEHSWKERVTLFVQIKGRDRVDAVHQALQQYRDNNNRVREDFLIKQFVVEPFVGMARRDAANDVNSWTRSANPVSAVVGPTVMAVMILILACFNLTNTAIAVSSRRLKEIGLRKVMGGYRSQLILQFIGETTFICFLSLLLGLVMGELLLDAWNSLWTYMKLESHYMDTSGFLIFITLILLFTGVLAGSYPAFYISSFEPVSILKGQLRFGGTNNFTRALLALQYAISLIAIISAVAFIQNAQFQKSFDLGFDKEGVIISYINSEGEFNAYKNLLAQNPDIKSIAGSAHSVYSARYNDPIKHKSKQIEVDILDVGDGYLSTMGLTLISGRDFHKDSETDRKESVIVSEKLAESFRWTDPLGKEIIWMDTVKLYVVGVIKDVYTQGLWREMEPMMLRYTSPDKYSHLIVSTAADKIPVINDFMQAKWKEVFPNRLYNGRMIVQDLSEASDVNNSIVKMFLFMGMVAMLLSATGLFSLVSLNIIRKMKEIGVRKVLGASVLSITREINTEFVIILLIASFLGCYLSYISVDMLMGGIWKYYQGANLVSFVLSVSLLFTVSGLTIGFKIYSAATMNPVKTLRSE